METRIKRRSRFEYRRWSGGKNPEILSDDLLACPHLAAQKGWLDNEKVDRRNHLFLDVYQLIVKAGMLDHENGPCSGNIQSLDLIWTLFTNMRFNPNSK